MPQDATRNPLPDDLPPLPEGWRWVMLEEIAEIVGGGTPSRSHPEYFKGDVVWLTPTEIDKNNIRVVYTSKEKITQEAVAKSSAKLLPPGTVLMTSRASIGYVAIAGTNVTTNQGFASFVCTNKVLNWYLAYWLWSQAEVFKKRGTGTTFKEITKSKLKSFYFPLAPLPEQERIVARIEALFAHLERAVAALERARRNLKRYRAAVLKAAVEGDLITVGTVGTVGATGRSPRQRSPRQRSPRQRSLRRQSPRQSGAALLARILEERRRRWEQAEWEKLIVKAKKKAAQARRKAAGARRDAPRLARLRDIPREEWEAIPEAEYARYLPPSVRATRELPEAIKRKYKEPAPPDTANLPELPPGWVWATVEMVGEHVTSGSRGWAKYYAKSGSLFIRVGNFNRLTVDLDLQNLTFVRPPSGPEANRTRLQNGDLLLTITADVGMVGLVDERVLDGYDDAYINQHVCLIRPTRIDVAPYISYALASEFVQKQIEQKQYGATKKGLNLDDVKSLIFPLPPLDEQRRIVAEVERRLSVARRLEETVETNLRRLARLRQSILKAAFEGRLGRP